MKDNAPLQDDEVIGQQVREKALELLVTDYIEVKRIVSSLEVYMKRRSRKAVYELRDFFDHVAIILAPDTPLSELKHHFEECKTHLRRATVEPLEYRAEKSLQKILRYEKFLCWIPYPFGDNPFRDPAYARRVEGIRKLITGLRTKKPLCDVAETAKQAAVASEDLLAEVQNPRHMWKRIAIAAILIIVGAVVGLIRWLK